MSKPKFDPNQPFEIGDNPKPKFDPSQAFDVVDEPGHNSGFSPETALRSYGNAMTFGYGDNLRAAVEPTLFKALNAITGNDVESDPDYVSRRDSEIKKTHQLEEDNPWSSRIGTGAGILNSMALPIANAAKGATPLARIGRAAAAGGTMGLIQNPGDVEGESSGLQLGDRALNMGIGAAIGGGLQGAGEAVAGAPKYFKNLAEEKAVKATGAGKAAFKRLYENDEVNQMGRQLLDDKIVTPLARPKDISQRIDSKIADKVGLLSDHLDQAEKTLADASDKVWTNGTPDQVNSLIKGNMSTDDIKNEVVQKLRDKFKGVPEEKLAPALQEVETWFNNRPEKMGVKDLQEMKVAMNNFLKNSDFYAPNPGLAKEGTLAVRSGIKNAIEQKGDAAAQILGDPTGQIKATNQGLGNLYKAQDFTQDVIGRDAANRGVSLTDYLAGGIGSHVAGPNASAAERLAMGVAGGAINKVGRMFGNSVQATGFDAFSKGLMAVSPKFYDMAQKSPNAFFQMARSLYGSGKFTPRESNPNQNGFQLGNQNDRVMDIMQNNPNQIDSIKNQKLKEQMQKQIEDRKFKEKVPVDEAQAAFLDGN